MSIARVMSVLTRAGGSHLHHGTLPHLRGTLSAQSARRMGWNKGGGEFVMAYRGPKRHIAGGDEMNARLTATIALLAAALMVLSAACESTPTRPPPTPTDTPPTPTSPPPTPTETPSDGGGNEEALERAQAELDKHRALWRRAAPTTIRLCWSRSASARKTCWTRSGSP